MLQLALAGIWMLDAILQSQPVFFTPTFAHAMIAPLAHGNPSAVAHSISSVATAIGNHPSATNTPFTLIQLLLAVGIAWRPTVKIALASSIVWSLAVWWFGEGLGGILNGVASPLNGAPGAVLLYAVAAVLVWPSERSRGSSPFVAAGLIGEKAARAVWVAIWGGLAYFALSGFNRSPNGLRDLVGAMAPGEPHWLASVDTNIASLLANRGLAASVVISALFVAVALGVMLPSSLTRAALLLGIVVAAIIWVVGENFGTILAGGATDPNSGPLLVLIAVCYWPRAIAPSGAKHAESFVTP
jgi:hypothetical protein